MIIANIILATSGGGGRATVRSVYTAIITTFHRDNPVKSTTTSSFIDTALPMAQPSMRPKPDSTQGTKQKRDRPAKSDANKRAKKN